MNVALRNLVVQCSVGKVDQCSLEHLDFLLSTVYSLLSSALKNFEGLSLRLAYCYGLFQMIGIRLLQKVQDFLFPYC